MVDEGEHVCCDAATTMVSPKDNMLRLLAHAICSSGV